MHLSSLFALFAAILVRQFAEGNFHILSGLTCVNGQDGCQIVSNTVSYAPSNQYDCGWLGGFSPVRDHELHMESIKYPSDVTFTSPVPICGVENMVFHYKESGGFDLTDENGAAGDCYPNEDESLYTMSCGNWLTSATFWSEQYVCYSYACQGKSCSCVRKVGMRKPKC